MARILYFSHPSKISCGYEDLYHVSSTRSFWMGAELAGLGHEVVSPVYGSRAWPPKKLPPYPTMKFVPFDDIPGLGSFDLIFCHQFSPSYTVLVNCALAKKYEKKDLDGAVSRKLASYLETLPVLVQTDHSFNGTGHRDVRFEEFARSRIRAIGLSAPNAKCSLGCFSFFCPPSVVPDRPDAPPGDDPYPDSRTAGRPVAVYLGRLNDNCRPSMSRRLNMIATASPDVDFYVISGKVRGDFANKAHLVVHDDDKNQAVHDERVSRIREIFTARNVKFLPSPSYDRTFRYIMHADLGISLSVRMGQDIASCKTWEYVSCGLPTVCDDELPEAFLCRNYGLSNPFKFDDAESASVSIRDALERNVDRAGLIGKMRKEHSYKNRAERWSAVMNRLGFGI